MLRNLKKKKNGKGFTLIELIIVIAIIAIISAIAIPKLLTSKKDADNKADFANAKVIANAYITAVAEGDINPTNTTTFTTDTVATTGLSLATSTDAAIVSLKTKLQGIPTTNTPAKKTFFLVLDRVGGITIFNADAAGTAKGTVQLFPQA